MITVFGGAQSFDYLDINNIKARVNALPMQFFDPSVSTGSFEAPMGSGKNTVFATSMWVAGKDVGLMTHGAIGGYDPLNPDWQMGPMMDFVHYATEVPSWDSVWKVNASEIDFFLAGGTPIPPSILNWPAHGDTSLGQDFYLAPFYDVDGDGLYNPANGDYPKIKGEQAIWFIMNDDLTHFGSDCSRLQLEVRVMAYAFSCSANDALENTIFLEYTMINRSTLTYYDTHVGQWSDLDIGCSEDDFIGCDVERGTYYGYNGDVFDEDCSGSLGYASDVPFQGVVFLAGPEQDADSSDNPVTVTTSLALASDGIPYEYLGYGYDDGIIDNERLGLTRFRTGGAAFGPMASPSTCVEYDEYLSGFWLDGTPVTYDGVGYGGATPAKYMYPGSTDPLFWGTEGVGVPAWDESTVMNPPGDRRGLGITGSFTMEPDEWNVFELAYVFGQDSVVGGLVSMQNRVDEIHEMFRNDSTPCGSFVYTSVSEQMATTMDVLIYPNPGSDVITIGYSQPGSAELVLYNIVGETVLSKTLPHSGEQVDISGLSEGVYIAVVAADGAFQQRKIIISR